MVPQLSVTELLIKKTTFVEKNESGGVHHTCSVYICRHVCMLKIEDWSLGYAKKLVKCQSRLTKYKPKKK